MLVRHIGLILSLVAIAAGVLIIYLGLQIGEDLSRELSLSHRQVQDL